MSRILGIILVLIALTALAEGGDVLWTFQGIENINCLAELPDRDGDGAPEIVIHTYDAGAVGDHTWCVSGGDSGTPAVFWSIRPLSGVSDGGGYGDDCIRSCPDLSGDGYPDILLGTAWGNRSVHAVNGMTGEVLWTFDTYLEFDTGWIYSVAWHPDSSGDGVPEVLVAVGSENNCAYMLDGATGAKLYTFLGAADALYSALSMPDIDGDEVPDAAFAAGDYDHRVYCVSGASSGYGQQLWSYDTGGSNHSLALLDDINADGVADLAVSKWTQTNQVEALSGATGQPLWSFNIGTYQYGMRIASMSDADGDGHRDLIVGSWDRALSVVSGLTGDLIWKSYAGTLNGGDFWSVDRVGDLTGDGVDEVVGGSFDYNVYLFNGATGDTLWMVNTARRLFTVRGVGDLSGAEGADVVAGTQFLSWGGVAYAIDGGTATAINDWILVEGSACLVGTSALLDWTCDQPLPFRVYRQTEAQGRVLGRRLLAEAFEAGQVGTRELTDLVVLQEQPEFELLTPEALLPEDAGSGFWRYAFTDTEAWGPARYRLAAMREGEEVFVLDLLAEQEEGLPPAVLRSAALHPNPFNPITEIRFELAVASRVGLAVFDAAGRRVDSVKARPFEAGKRALQWRAPAGLASGVYMISLEAGVERRTLRAVLLK